MFTGSCFKYSLLYLEDVRMRADEGRLTSVSLSFVCDVCQFVERDELILLLCFLFLNKPSLVQNMTQNLRISG